VKTAHSTGYNWETKV